MCKQRKSLVDDNRMFCQECRQLNEDMIDRHCDLTGRYAIVTGGRIKIGFETALMLLRDGCFVIVTTRFPGNALSKFSNHSDFDKWKDRLKILRLDLQDVQSINEFLNYVHETIPHLDILINNAAQTIHRPFAYYQPMIQNDLSVLKSLNESEQT